MKIDRFLQFFVVKEKKFYPLYIEQAVNIEAAAKLLVELLQEQDPDKQKMLYKDIKEYEHSGDKITVQLYEELNKTFVTPFDREDINLLGGRMDTFLDFIHDAGKADVNVSSEGREPVVNSNGPVYCGGCPDIERHNE